MQCGSATSTFSVTATDANGCTASTSATVTEPTALTATTSVTNVLCNGGNGTVEVSANGGTAPYTGTGSYTVAAGTYNYTVTDANGCTTTTSVTVTEPTALTATTNHTNVSCNGGLDGESDELISNMKVATEPIMIIVGSEGKGLHKLTREKCDLVVKIPMRSTTESLNASVATSIALYAVDEARK